MDSFEFDHLNEARDSFGPAAAVLEGKPKTEAPLSLLEEKMVTFANAVAELPDNPDPTVVKNLHAERMRIMNTLRPRSGGTPPTVAPEHQRYFDAMNGVFWQAHADAAALRV